MPADAVVDPGVANNIVDCIVQHGTELEKMLVKMGVVEGEAWSDRWTVNLQKLGLFFNDHCVVILGRLAHSYWPKYRRSTKEPMQ
eukprot:2662532-Karenia_brevis.AAC.1